ncbi:MAG: hypothetical protein O3A01_00365 [bacterium]|nr:hypothetical protein [bacterium]
MTATALPSVAKQSPSGANSPRKNSNTQTQLNVARFQAGGPYASQSVRAAAQQVIARLTKSAPPSVNTSPTRSPQAQSPKPQRRLESLDRPASARPERTPTQNIGLSILPQVARRLKLGGAATPPSSHSTTVRRKNTFLPEPFAPSSTSTSRWKPANTLAADSVLEEEEEEPADEPVQSPQQLVPSLREEQLARQKRQEIYPKTFSRPANQFLAGFNEDRPMLAIIQE